MRIPLSGGTLHESYTMQPCWQVWLQKEKLKPMSTLFLLLSNYWSGGLPVEIKKDALILVHRRKHFHRWALGSEGCESLSLRCVFWGTG